MNCESGSWQTRMGGHSWVWQIRCQISSVPVITLGWRKEMNWVDEAWQVVEKTVRGKMGSWGDTGSADTKQGGRGRGRVAQAGSLMSRAHVCPLQRLAVHPVFVVALGFDTLFLSAEASEAHTGSGMPEYFGGLSGFLVKAMLCWWRAWKLCGREETRSKATGVGG